MKPLTKQWSAALCCFHTLMCEYSSQQFSKTPSQRSLKQHETCFTPIQINMQMYTYFISTSCFSNSRQQSKGLCKRM